MINEKDMEKMEAINKILKEYPVVDVYLTERDAVKEQIKRLQEYLERKCK